MKKFLCALIFGLAVMLVYAGAAQPPLVQPNKKEEFRYSPYNAAQIANDDIIAVEALSDPALNPEYVRYLSLHSFPEAVRPIVKDVVDFVLNSLNARFRRIIRTAGLPNNAKSPVVLRVNLIDYGIDPKAWDRLAENGSGPTPLPDPYFHARITRMIEIPAVTETVTRKVKKLVKKTQIREWFGGRQALEEWWEEQEVDESYEKEVTPSSKQKKEVLAAAPWLAIERDPTLRGSVIANLVKLTQTGNPILRADWFVVYATWAPAYYDLIGLPLRDNPDKVAAQKKPKVFLEKDFQKLVGADLRAAERDILAAITDTRIVTLHNRILHRYNTPTGLTGGFYWRSQDTDKGIDDQDYLNQISNFDNPKFVATEIIASGRNGMNFYFVADANGVGLDLAAAAVAQHSDAMPCKYQDKQIFVARNCMLCHSNGMIQVNDKVRNISQDKIALFVADKTKDQVVATKIMEAFSPDIKPVLDLDNARFLASVQAACGKGGRVIGSAQEDLIWNYWDKGVTLDHMAYEAGLPAATLRKALQAGINLDYTLVAILQNTEEPIARLTWERQGFSALMTYLIGYQPK